VCEGSSVHRREVAAVAAAVQDRATEIRDKVAVVVVLGKATVVLDKEIVDQGKGAAVQGTPIPKIHRADLGVAAVEVANSLVVAVVVRGKAMVVAAGPSSTARVRARCKAGSFEQVSRRTEVGLVGGNDPTWWMWISDDFGFSLGGWLMGPESVE
jgi:hypothetical protein